MTNEKSLNSDNQGLWGIINNDPDGKIIVDKKDIVLFANPAAMRLFEREAGKFVGHKFKYTAITGKDAEIEFLKKDGSVGRAEMRSSVATWQEQEVLLVSLRDITGRGWVEELLDRNATLSVVFESTPNIMMLVDEDGRVLDINRAGVEFAGRSKEELLGLLGGDVFNCLNSFHGKGCGKNAECADCPVRSRVMRTLETQEPIFNEEGEFEIERHGETVKLHILISTSLINISGGKQVLVTITDITERKTLEQTLRLEDQRYREFFMNSPFGYQSLDNEGRIKDVNQAWLNGLGYSREEVIGKWFGDFLAPEQADIFRERFPKFKAAGKTHAEFLMKHKDGSVTLEAIDGKVAYDLTGAFKHTHCVLQDVTEARRAEAIIQQSRQKYQALFESSGDAAFVHQPTPEGLPGVFLEVNQAACALLGYTKAELLKLGPRDIVVWEKAGVTPPDIMKRLETDKKVTMESAYRHKDGHEIPIEVVVHRFELLGKPAVLTLARDITARNKAEQQLKASEEKYRLLTEHIPSAITVLQNGKIVFANPQAGQITGYSSEELFELDIFNLVHPEDRNRVQEFLRLRIQGKEAPAAYSMRIIRKDGEIIWLRRRIVMIEWQDAPAVLALDTDITVRIKAEQLLMEKTNQLEQFFNSPIDLLSISDTAGHFIRLSHAWEKVLGYKLKELEGFLFLEFVHPDDIAATEEAMRLLMKQHQVVDFVNRYRHKDGSYRWILWNSSPVMDTVYSTALDITEQKEAEASLKQSAQELENRNTFIQMIIDQLPIGLAINNIADGRATYHNRKFEEIYGWSKEDITDIQTFFEKVYPDPVYRQAIISRVMTDIESGDPVRMQWGDIEITTKSGEKRVIFASNIPIPDQGIMVSTVRDVTAQKRAEKELIHTRDLMRYVIEHNTSGVAIHDKDLNYMYVSQRYLDEYKLTEQEIIGRHHYEVFPDLPDKWKLIHQRALTGDVVSANEDPYLRDDGSMEWTRWECRPWYQLDGAVGGLIVYTEVITDRIQEQQTLRQSEEKYRLLAENTESISWEYDVVIDRWTYVAPQVQRIMGYKPEDWTDLKFWTDHIHEDDRKWASLYCMECTRAGKPHIFEYRFIKKDGGVIWLRDVVSVEMKEDNPIKLRGIMFDVTGHKQMEQSLAEAAEEWSTTFDSITDMVAIVDKNHKITRVNHAFARVLGKNQSELVGEPCYKVIHGMNQPHPMCPHARTLETRQVESSEYFDKKLGIWVEASASPIFDDQGNLTGSVHIIQDISSRKEAEVKEQQLRNKAELSSRLAAVGEMAAGIAHEINNPLTGVIGFSELLLGREDLPEDMKVELKIINDGSQRVKDIVRRMLTFARQSKPVRSSVSIEELLDNTLELRNYVMRTANIEVVRDYAPDLPWVTADAGQLQQVFLNIIVNAEFAMKKANSKGVLIVKTEKRDGHIRVLITDDGPGMPEEVKNKLFQPFFTTKDPGEGTGLGLALSMGII
ncbi:PAS domain S-box protein [Dehalogenimonas sp. THU2]|uniref:PAS domain S-box protein n=1 Tax=Dehalogenimonas sp. THU2 TaxID=3151121 RepID=UPI003218B116